MTVLLATVAMVVALGAASAAAQTSQVGLFRLTVGGLNSGAKFSLRYGGESRGTTGQASVDSGVLETVGFNRDGFRLTSFGSEPLSGVFNLQIELGTAPKLSRVATVPLAGGASNRRLIVKLTDTNLRLVSVTAVPRSSDGGYLLTGGHFSAGGSEYVVTLNAANANPKGSHLVLKFGTAR